MKTAKPEITFEFECSSKLFFFPDLFPNKKLNIEIGMEFFHSNIRNDRD